MNQSVPKVYVTQFGSLNCDGGDRSFSSEIVGMMNPQLPNVLEPAIAPLVIALQSFGLITYTSCEGHNFHTEIYEAHVGVIYKQLYHAKIWQIVSCAADAGFCAYRTWLTDTEDGKRHPTIELYFPYSSSQTFLDYHASLAQAIEIFSFSAMKHVEDSSTIVRS